MPNLSDNTNLTGTITVSKATGTKVTLDTDHKYIDKDIELTINVPTASATISGGELSGTATASSSTAAISSSTNTSGISFTTACSATRAAITCSASTAGWASETIGTLASESTELTDTTYYINEVSLPKGKSFTIQVYTDASTQIKFQFTTDANGNTTVTESQ